MVGLAALCAGLGLAPVLFWPAVSRAVGVWHPAWVATATPAPLVSLGAVHGVLAMLLVTAAAWLWQRARANGLRRGLTWDCAYAAPTAHMQYSSGSFAGITIPWFAWILRPALSLRRPRGPFPAGALRLEYVPETMLERGLVPAAGVVLRVSTAVRRLQHGRLQSYILYLLVGLAVLSCLVALGGTP
jgi:hydrogenase-4 component B